VAQSSHQTDPLPDDEPAPTELVTVRLRARDLERLDHAAERRGIGREAMMAEAIDAFLAREMWSGGFIAPPPPMEIPGRWPWRAGAFRPHRRE